MSLSRSCWCRLAALALILGGCAPTPSPPPAAAKADCGVGGSARGVAAGFFALVEDRPECF